MAEDTQIIKNVKPWLQQEGELHYEVFLAFLQLGSSRTVKSAKDSSHTKISIDQLNRLCTKFQWHKRAEEYDKWLALEAIQILEKERPSELAEIKSEIQEGLHRFIVNVVKIAGAKTTEELKKLEVEIAIVRELGGKGQSITKLIEAHRALFGDKHEISGTIKAASVSTDLLQFHDLPLANTEAINVDHTHTP